MKSAQDDDLYSTDDFASDNYDSPVHKFETLGGPQHIESLTPNRTEPHESSESEDNYSMDDDFVGSSSQEKSEDDDQSSLEDVKSACDAAITKVEHEHPPRFSTTQLYSDESSGYRDASLECWEEKESSVTPIQTSTHYLAEKTKQEPDGESIGDVNCKTGEIEAAICPSLVGEIPKQTVTLKTPKHDEKKIPSRCRVSFDPQRTVIESKSTKIMKSDHEKSHKGHHYSKQRLDELSKPTKHNIYNSSDKGVQSKKKAIVLPDDERSFLDRMKIMETEKREKLQRAAAELLYNAKVDKVCHTSILLIVSLRVTFRPNPKLLLLRPECVSKLRYHSILRRNGQREKML